MNVESSKRKTYFHFTNYIIYIENKKVVGLTTTSVHKRTVKKNRYKETKL